MLISRRGLLTAGAALGAFATGFIKPISAGATQSGTTADAPDAPPAQPDFVLDVQERSYSSYGSTFPAKLVGGTWPGTAIRYKKGDTFRVLIRNHLDEPTGIHWHGLLLPSLMDGVPDISQLPIPAKGVQYYEYPIIQSGTYYYHSHYGVQEQYGVLGPLIIDDPDDPYTYDLDQVVMFSDIIPIPGKEVVSRLRSGKMTVNVRNPYLPPGAKAFDTDLTYAGYTINGHSNDAPWSLSVKPGQRIRLRLINSSGSSFFRVSIDGLRMTVIQADGNPVNPVVVDDLTIATSERYDVLVDVSQSGSYTLHGAALGDDKQAIGVIHTADAPPRVVDAPARFTGKSLAYSDLKSVVASPLASSPTLVHDVILGGDMKAYEWTMNGNYWPELFAGPDAKKTFLDVSFGDVVRLRMINKTTMAHPMHLHGHRFRVLGQGDDRFAPLKDSVWVKAGQTLDIEFLADNPGLWAYHCHNIWHLGTGMLQPVRYTLNAA